MVLNRNYHFISCVCVSFVWSDMKLMGFTFIENLIACDFISENILKVQFNANIFSDRRGEKVGREQENAVNTIAPD